MSLEVKSNKEIKKIKAEIFMGMGIREISIISIAAVIVFVLFLKLTLPVMVICYLASPLIAAATMLIAFRPCGMIPEQFLIAMLRSIFVNRRCLKYSDEKMKGVFESVIKDNRKAGLRETKNT